jgi:hypothetical protein
MASEDTSERNYNKRTQLQNEMRVFLPGDLLRLYIAPIGPYHFEFSIEFKLAGDFCQPIESMNPECCRGGTNVISPASFACVV